MEHSINTHITETPLLKRALALAKTPILISFFLTPIRFSLELLGLPENAIFIIGLLWLTLAFAIYWGIKCYNEAQPFVVLFMSLLIFSPISRIPVFIIWWIDKHWAIGTHYGLFFDSWPQALLNQVAYGALVQIIPGFIVGALTLIIMKYKTSVTA